MIKNRTVKIQNRNSSSFIINNWTKPPPMQFHLLQSPPLNYKLAQSRQIASLSQNFVGSQQKIQKVKLKSRHKQRFKFKQFQDQVIYLQTQLAKIDNLMDSQVLAYHQKMLITYLNTFQQQLRLECSQKANFIKTIWNSLIRLFNGVTDRLISQNKKQQKSHLSQNIKTHKEYQQKMENLLKAKIQYSIGEKKYQDVIRELMKAVGTLNARSKGLNTLYDKAVDNLRQLNQRYNQIRSDYIQLMVSIPNGMSYMQAESYIKDKQMFLLAKQLQKSQAKVKVKPKSSSGRKARIINNDINVQQLLEQLQAEEDYQFEIDFKPRKILNVRHTKMQTDKIGIKPLIQNQMQTQYCRNQDLKSKLTQTDNNISEEFAQTQIIMTGQCKIHRVVQESIYPNQQLNQTKFLQAKEKSKKLREQLESKLEQISPQLMSQFKNLFQMIDDNSCKFVGYSTSSFKQRQSYKNKQKSNKPSIMLSNCQKQQKNQQKNQKNKQQNVKQNQQLQIQLQVIKKKNNITKNSRSGKLLTQNSQGKLVKGQNIFQLANSTKNNSTQSSVHIDSKYLKQKRVSELILLSNLKKQLLSKNILNEKVSKQYINTCKNVIVQSYNGTNINNCFLQLTKISEFQYKGYHNRHIGIQNKYLSNKIQMGSRRIYGGNKCIKTISDLIKFIHISFKQGIKSINPSNLAAQFLSAIQGKLLSTQGKQKKFIQFLRISAPFCAQSFMVRNFFLICGISAHQYQGLRVNRAQNNQGLAYFMNSSQIEIYFNLLSLGNCNLTDELMQAYTTYNKFTQTIQILNKYYHPKHKIIQQSLKTIAQGIQQDKDSKLDIFKCIQLVLQKILTIKAKICEQLNSIYDLVQNKQQSFTYDIIKLLAISPKQIYNIIRLLQTIYKAQCIPQTMAAISLMQGYQIDTNPFLKIQQQYKYIILKKIKNNQTSSPLLSSIISLTSQKNMKKNQFLILAKIMWHNQSQKISEQVLGSDLTFLNAICNFTKNGQPYSNYHKTAFDIQ